MPRRQTLRDALCRFRLVVEYDLVSESMIRLKEHVSVTQTEVQELLEAGCLTLDCLYPYKLYKG